MHPKLNQEKAKIADVSTRPGDHTLLVGASRWPLIGCRKLNSQILIINNPQAPSTIYTYLIS